MTVVQGAQRVRLVLLVLSAPLDLRDHVESEARVASLVRLAQQDPLVAQGV